VKKAFNDRVPLDPAQIESDRISKKLITQKVDENKSVRRGYTKIHKASSEIQKAIMVWYSKGYGTRSIMYLLLKDYGYDVTAKTLNKYILSQRKDVGEFVADNDDINNRLRNEFANVVSGLNMVQSKLMKKFNEALVSDDLEAVTKYAKLISENVELSHKILGSNARAPKPADAPKSLGQMISIIGERKKASKPSR
jgi:hypothetical protein